MEADKGQKIKKAKINEFEFGLRPDYTKIGLYQSDNYAFRKHLLNPLPGLGYIDLIKTGSTVNSLFPVRSGRGFILDSQKDLWKELQGRYGKDIRVINQDTFNKIQVEDYAPDFRKYIKQIMGI